MPLIRCPDCTKDVSDAASACPHCARPLTPVPTGADDSNGFAWLLTGILLLSAVIIFAATRTGRS